MTGAGTATGKFSAVLIAAEQVGVREFCTGTEPTYASYVRMNGLYEIQSFDPAPGDEISASVSCASGKYGEITFRSISITDQRGRRGSFASNRHWKVTRLDEYYGTKLAASSSLLRRSGSRFSDTWHHS
jgi:hypothetical protein